MKFHAVLAIALMATMAHAQYAVKSVNQYKVILHDGIGAYSDDPCADLDTFCDSYEYLPITQVCIANCPPGAGLGIASTPVEVWSTINNLPAVQEVIEVEDYIIEPIVEDEVSYEDYILPESKTQACGKLSFPSNPPGGNMPNLDRADQCDADLDRQHLTCPNGLDHSSLGKGAMVFVIDTGCTVNHIEGNGRWKCGKATPNCADGNGHGTHCAGTATGKTVGLARAADVTCIDTDLGGGRLSGTRIAQGYEEAAAYKVANPTTPVIASCSFGGGGGPDPTVARISRLGVVVVVAAGNSNADACRFSPASTPEAITVGALNPDGKTKASFSNFGKCVDVSQIGVQVYSSYTGGNNSYRTLSGTSMSCPLVSGMCALILTRPGYTPGTNDPAVCLEALTKCGTVAADPRLQIVASVSTNQAPPPPPAGTVLVAPKGRVTNARPAFRLTTSDRSAKHAYAYVTPLRQYVYLPCDNGRCEGRPEVDVNGDQAWTGTVLAGDGSGWIDWPAWEMFTGPN